MADNYIPSSFNRSTWQDQGKKNVEDTASTGSAHERKYRSAAIQCEIKLTEALSRSKASKKFQLDDDDKPRPPDAFRLAVCMQMLGEICELSGPFAHVLNKIRDELALGVFSDYHANEDGSLNYEQLPFFTVVGRLEKEKGHMLKEREQFRCELLSRTGDIVAIEERMKELEHAVTSEREQNKELLAELEETLQKLDRSRAEAKHTKDELKRLKRTCAKLESSLGLDPKEGKDELDEFVKEQTLRLELEEEVHLLKEEMNDLRKENLEMFSREAYDEVSSELEAAGEEMETLRGLVADQSNVALTPRPKWEEKHMPHGEHTSTVQSVDMLLERLQTYEFWTTEAAPPSVSYEEACYLIAPDPDLSQQPSMDWVARILAEVKGSRSIDLDAEQCVVGKRCGSLGTGFLVPRYLRSREPFDVMIPSKQDTVRLVREVWEEKATSNASRRELETLPALLYKFLLGRFKMHKTVTQFSYNLRLALQRHSDAQPELLLFKHVLDGHLSEDVYWDRVAMERGLQVAFVMLDAATTPPVMGVDDASAPASGLVNLEDAPALFSKYFPHRTVESQALLTESFSSFATQEGDKEVVEYVGLFAENAHEANRDSFLSVVRQQHLDEIAEYVSGLEQHLMECGDVSNHDAPDNVPLPMVLDALAAYDDAKPMAELELYVLRGARLAEMADVDVPGSRVTTSAFMSRLKGGLVKRSGNYDLKACVENDARKSVPADAESNSPAKAAEKVAGKKKGKGNKKADQGEGEELEGGTSQVKAELT